MSSEPKPLTADQRRAASLMAAGMDDKATAADVGVAPKTIQRWKVRDDFRALVRKQREGLMPETPTAEAVLTTALSATRKDGFPDWTTRIAAARAILCTEVASPEAHAQAERVTEIYLPPDDDAPRPFPVEGVRDGEAA